MTCLVDTGILLRAFDASFAEYRIVRAALRNVLARGETLITTVQNMAEFWNVSTRPVDKNGYALSIDRVKRRIGIIEQFCTVVTEDHDSYRIWKHLLETRSISGVAVHDARLVSVMLSQGIGQILTLNARDFSRYDGIFVLTPGKDMLA